MSNTSRPEPNPFDIFDPLPVSPLAKVAPAALSMVPSGFQAMAQPPAKVPNYFDQFDEPAPAGGSAENPFARFHQQPAAAAGGMIEVEGPDGAIVEFPHGTSDDVMSKALQTHYGTPAAKPQIDAAGGGIVHGLVNAVTGFLGGPGTLQQLERGAAGNALESRGYPGAASVVRAVPALPSGADLNDMVGRVMGPLYRKPETTAGQYAGSIAENAPAAMLVPGSLMARIMGAVVPGVTAETAARVAPAGHEDAARFAGGLAGNLGAARMNAGDRAVVAATHGTTPEQLRAGQPVLDQGAGIGVPLSGPEGIQHITDGATGLGKLQRVVEGSTGGGPTMAQFYADRPMQMRTAADNAFDTIAPQSAAPSTLGSRVATAADTAINDVRQGINAQTRPDYAAAEAHVMQPQDFDAMRTPAFDASLQRLRADPVLGPELAQHPDNSGRVIDLVTKDMGARGQALSASGEGFNPLAAERYSSGAADARDILRDPARGGTQAYDDALTAQAQARTQNLDPLEQGPVGQLAKVGNSGAGVHSGSQAAQQTILPATTERGQNVELADATRRIGAIDPEAIAQLVRQRMGNQYDASATDLVGGGNHSGGAKFAKDMAGTPQKQANIDAVLGALPNSPAAPQSVNTLLDTLRATGRRLPAGSNTSADRAMQEALSEQSTLGEAVTALRTQGRSLFANVGGKARQAALGRHTGRLADLFTAPDSADRIADIVQRGVEPVFANALLRQSLQTPGAMGQR
ncbi:hypothetical protein ACFZ8E_23540 [Methylobacterium sp. HMF5984]|uniref:hypothetical protein n=1 Tax=Methylobacterium sp. HMF5984 TaxID=3367370 RepID=UPI003852C3C4